MRISTSCGATLAVLVAALPASISADALGPDEAAGRLGESLEARPLAEAVRTSLQLSAQGHIFSHAAGRRAPEVPTRAAFGAPDHGAIRQLFGKAGKEGKEAERRAARDLVRAIVLVVAASILLGLMLYLYQRRRSSRTEGCGLPIYRLG